MNVECFFENGHLSMEKAENVMRKINDNSKRSLRNGLEILFNALESVAAWDPDKGAELIDGYADMLKLHYKLLIKMEEVKNV